MLVEKAQISDLPQILDLQKLCYKENAERYNSYNIPPLTQSLNELESEFSKILLLKISTNTEIIGSIRAFTNNNTCYIGRLIVHPKHQNKGLGKKLLQQAEIHFNHADRYELFTGFRDEKNLYFYKKYGYNEFKKEQLENNVSIVYLEKLNIVKQN